MVIYGYLATIVLNKNNSLYYIIYNVSRSIYLQSKYDKWHLFEETLREKCVKFKESDTPANPEPSLSKRLGKEGAETIIRYLNTHTITSA